jgi:ankyrin
MTSLLFFQVASVLIDHNASLVSMTKKGFTPLHLAAKYGNLKVSNLLLEKNSTPAVVDAEGKNGVTPLHVAAHYDHQNVALLLLDKVP